MDELVEYHKVNEMVIRDSSTRDCNMIACWQGGNKIMTFAPALPDNQDNFRQTGPVYLHNVQLNTDMEHPTSRKLINESHMVFASLQQMRKEVKDKSLDKSLLLKFSRKYRSILHSNFLEIRLKLEGEHENHEAGLEQQMKLYSMMELIWSLCEILFVENLPDGAVLLQLVEWCKWHFPLADELVQECTRSVDETPPASHPSYWDAVYALVLQGRVSEARDMLKLHPHYQTQVYDSFSSIDELLRKMPLFSFYQGQSTAEFEMKWRHWQDECLKRLHDGDFDTVIELKTICKILCGDEEVFHQLSELSGSWYRILITYLLYTNPTINLYDLHYHSKLCIDMYGGHTELSALDNILLAAFKFDVSQVIRECCIHLSNWWLPTHLTDLIYYSELIPNYSSENSSDLRDFLLVQYANAMSGVESLWDVVASYLASCSTESNHYLALYVQRIPLSSEKKVAKILRLCEKYQLTTEAQSICKQMAMKALTNKRLGNALLWCIKSNDSSFAMYIADQMLTEYAQTGTFSNIDVIDYLGPTILMSERLTFLGKYRDFHRLHGEEKFEEAGRLLLNLLVSRIAPMELWLSLLMDALPLLDKDKIIYGVEETSSLLACLNTLDQQDKLFSKLSESEKRNHLQRIKHLRLSLTNNLARAIVS
uniref:Nuclear pore complex protein Nup85 n=1 Tax=Phallusia mammillata TaxID=59560 RepID=A0A6F9DNE3_9ASCI|nr:nuclear pore complex protein Nup85-like [Phallusia mammillata]